MDVKAVLPTLQEARYMHGSVMSGLEACLPLFLLVFQEQSISSFCWNAGSTDVAGCVQE